MVRSFGFKFATVALATVAVASVASAQAAVPQSRLNFSGSVNIQDSPSNPANLLLDFLAGTNQNIGGTATGNVIAVPTINGFFTPGITPGTQGVIQDLTVSPTGVVGLPVTNFLSIGGYSFNLTGTQNSPGSVVFGPIALNQAGTMGSSATLAVFGTATGPGFTGTQTFSGVFTAQFAGLTPTQVFNTINSGGLLSAVSVSAEFLVPATAATVTPEPATYALLASGLGLLGLVARRRRQA